MQHIDAILKSWRGTPYGSGQQVRGPQGAVDCVRFGAGVLDDLYGHCRELPRNLALDSAVHSREAAETQVRAILRLYPELEFVAPGEDGLFTVEPGDAIVVGPEHGGPGHLMMVGARPNTLWEAIKPEVSEVGSTLDPEQRTLKHVLRANNRALWLR